MDNKLYNTYRAIKDGIISAWFWKKVVWKDRDWDYIFLYKILEFKLRRMSKYHRDSGHLVNNEKYARQMEKTAICLKRLIDDEYLDNTFRDHEKKYGQLEMWGTPTDRDDMTECNITRTKICNTDAYEQENKEARVLYKHVEELRNQDLDYVFNMMRKYIQGWWD